ncbi:MAG: hypothetical protein LBM00_03065 [Deltaproteobacteria bacterium]|jgi:hypothetical protein|nr:hypothetical protein [Deltaproteobacteria bacterium]
MLNTQQRPVILDFDRSVLAVSEAELRLELSGWQEDIRFGCSWNDYARLKDYLAGLLPEPRGPVFLGSGDYHHLTLLLLQDLEKRLKLAPASLDLVAADNHPDNMRYLFGLHCGSWIRHAAALACIRHIHVIGITSRDISLKQAWANYLGPFRKKKLTCWSVSSRADWLKLIGRGEQARCFASADDLLAAFLPVLRASARQTEGIYLSLDKDVLSAQVARSNWDQGVFELRHLEELIAECAGRLQGADLCGDVSAYAFTGLGKRLLLRLEGQPEIAAENMPREQEIHREVNKKLLAALIRCSTT